MATSIPLYQRSELPPSRAGIAKPPYSLADRSGQIRFGQTLAMFAGGVFDKINKAQAAAEESEAIGQAKALAESFQSIVASRPNASPEELRKEWGKIETQIKAIPSKLKNSIAKTNITNLLNSKMPEIRQSVQTSVATIKKKQELAKFEAGREQDINNLDELALTNRYEAMFEADLFDEKSGRIQLNNDIKVISVAQKKLAMEQLKVGVETQAFAIAAEQGYEAAEDMLRDPAIMVQLLEAGVKRKDARSLLNDIKERVKHQQVQEEEELDQQREVDKGKVYDAIETGQVKLEDGTISTDIRTFIKSTSLSEDEQANMWEKSKRETERKLKGEKIITVSQVRSQLYKDTMGILTGAQTRDDILERVKTARFGDYSDPKNPIEPTLSEKDYAPLVNAINAQYEQGYGQMMSKVNSYAEGILLQADSLGLVKNAPIRYRTLGDFQEAWLQWIANQGDKLKISEIYPEGRRLAATFQISDTEAMRQEVEVNKQLQLREGKTQKKRKKLTTAIQVRYLKMADGDIEEAKRLAVEDGYKE